MPKILYFPFYGPSRYSDRRLIEIRLSFTREDARQSGFDGFLTHVTRILRGAGALGPDDGFARDSFPGRGMSAYASLLAQTALLFQRQTGHRVGFWEVRKHEEPLRRTVLLQHEHCDVGMTAVKLAYELLSGKWSDLRPPYRKFTEFSRQRLLPLDTEAIIEAARERRIPCFQLERMPFNRNVEPERRVRPNGLLRLGHGARGRLLDGTFLADDDSDERWRLFSDAADRRAWLRVQGMEPVQAGEGERFHVLRTGSLDQCLRESATGEFAPVSRTNPVFDQLASRAQSALGGVAMDLILQGGSANEASPSDPGVFDLDLDPNLARLLAPGGRPNERLRAAAAALVDRLVPDPSRSRIPLVAITGTNGKTTTSLMTSRILQHAGWRPGLVCTVGLYVDGEKVAESDGGSPEDHARLLIRPDIDSAVLETHHRGIAIRGFPYRQNDVAVCLNVSEDHVAPWGIATMEEMVEIKRAVVERARGAAVIFADDPNCLGMTDHIDAERLWLVSLERSVQELSTRAPGRDTGFCVLETIDGEEWIVLHGPAEGVPLAASASIPATMDGAARHNVCNAMHAAVAAYCLGVPLGVIREALTGFRADPRETPGRLNIYDRLPFRVIADNAHNPDGLRQMMKFMDRQETTGRKVLVLSTPHNRTDRVYRQMARAVAGHFDLYFCADRVPKPGQRPDQHAPLLKEELLAAGITEGRVHVSSRGEDAWREVFAACGEGDLLLVVLSPVEFERFGHFVDEYAVPVA